MKITGEYYKKKLIFVTKHKNVGEIQNPKSIEISDSFPTTFFSENSEIFFNTFNYIFRSKI
jgi:hypothetical protein